MRRLLALPVIAALALPGAALAGPRAGASVAWTAKLTAPTHTPKARTRWPIKIVVRTASGRRLSGTVQYHFLFGGQVVSTQSCHATRPDPCPFSNGLYRDVIRWPLRSVGYQLTFQAVVKTKLGVKKLNYRVKVHR